MGPRIRDLAPEIERDRAIPAELIESLRTIGMFRALAPRSIGGAELDLQETIDSISELARADGSTAWVAMIGACSAFGYAFMDEAAARRVFDPAACTVGVFAPGRGVRVDGGLRVTGRWPFCSGVHHSDTVSLGVMVEDEGFRSMFVPTSEVTILDTWYVSGLRGTGSHDVTLDDVFVPADRVFQPFGGGGSVHPGPLFRFPTFGLLAAAVAAVALGVGRAAMDELLELAAGKTPAGSRRRLADRAHAQTEVARAEAELAASDALLRARIAAMWGAGEPTVAQRAELRLAATHATRSAAKVVDRMYDLGGGSSIYETSRLQRCFRDVHAITQHMVTAPATYELVGRILLGVETDVSQL